MLRHPPKNASGKKKKKKGTACKCPAVLNWQNNDKNETLTEEERSKRDAVQCQVM